MMRPVYSFRIIFCAAAVASLCSCQTIKIPNVDIMKSPEFSEEAANFAKEKDYPDVKDAPLAPTDIRSDEQWDKDVRVLLDLRGDDSISPAEPGPTIREADAEFERLKAKAQAYKKDDPITGPVQGFPNYEPPRR